MKKILWLACVSYFVIGIAHLIGGAVLEQLVTHYDKSYTAGGQWIMNQFLGFLVGVLFAPLVQKKIGQRGAIVAAFTLLTIAEVSYSLFLPWNLMLIIAPIAGLGFGAIEAILGSIIIDLFKENRASAMSKLEVFFGLGALGIPLLAAILIRNDIWQLAFPILAVMSLVTLLVWIFISFGKTIDTEIKKPTKGMESITLKYTSKTRPILIIGMIFFFLYVGIEMSISNYLPAIILQKTTFLESHAAALLGLFWIFMVLGRMVCGHLADKYGYMSYLLVSMLLSVIACFGLAIFENKVLLLVMISLAGVGFSGIFGIALVYVNSVIEGLTTRTTSLLIACGGIGGALLPKATGLLMDNTSANSSLLTIALSVALMFIVLVILALIGQRKKNKIHT